MSFSGALFNGIAVVIIGDKWATYHIIPMTCRTCSGMLWVVSKLPMGVIFDILSKLSLYTVPGTKMNVYQ